jgi:hypothetical protein
VNCSGYGAYMKETKVRTKLLIVVLAGDVGTDDNIILKRKGSQGNGL